MTVREPHERGRWHRRWHGRLRRSLGLRLVALFVVLALATVVIFLGGMQRALSFGFSDLVRPLVADYVDRLAAEIGSPPDLARVQALEQRLPIDIRVEGPLVRHDARADRPRRGDNHAGRGARDGRDGQGDPPGDHRGWWQLTRHTADGHRLTFRVGDAAWRDQPRSIGWVTLALLLCVTTLAYLAVRRLFRPIDDIRAGALRFGSGEFAQPIPVRRRDELGELAAQVNHMAANLQGMLDAKRALLLAISHELRSPLTRARLNAELVGDSAERDALLRDLAEMRDLITDLLEHERLAAGHAALHAEPVDVDELLRTLVAEQFPDAGIELQLDAGAGRVTLDPTRLRLAVRNLLANALRHGTGAPGTPGVRSPQLGSMRAGGRLSITVRDFGPGVAPEHLARLAEPFYRPDVARGRETGGVGLGLTLCRLVAQAHGGELVLTDAEPGLQARLVLPVAT